MIFEPLAPFGRSGETKLPRTTGSSSIARAKAASGVLPAGAVASGAKIVQMPALSCMAAVTDRGMSFTDFASGKQVDGFPESSFFDHERVWLWLNRDIPNMFLRIPAEWLPGIKQPLVANDRR